MSVFPIFFQSGFQLCRGILIAKPLLFCWLQIQRLSGVDSDFAPFVLHAGVPSIDMYYGRGMYLMIHCPVPDSLGIYCFVIQKLNYF